MSRRVLVVAETDPADPDHGKMLGLDPNEAVGIAIPAFRSVPTLPAAGTVEGEAVYDRSHKQGWIWTKGSWQGLAPNPIKTYATEAALLADKGASPGTYATAGDTGNLFIARAAGWGQVGIHEYKNAATLLAATPLKGALGEATDEGSLWEMTAKGWRCLTTRELADTAAVLAWANPANAVGAAGCNIGDQAIDVAHEVTYIRTASGWRPTSIWEAKESVIRAATWCVRGQDAIATDTGRTFTRLNGTWVEEPIAHFTTEALLLAASLPNGTLAWADDTSVVFTRAAGAWKRLQGPQISVGTTAPSTPGVGDLFYNTDKKLTEICTKNTPAVEWAIAGGEADLKTGVVTIPAGAGTWFELARGLTNKSGLYRVEIESGDGNNGSIITFEHHAMTNTGSQLRLVESDVLGTTEPTVDMVGVDWIGGSHHISARTSTRAGMTGWKLNVTVRALDGTDISGVVIGTVSATEPAIKLDVPKVFPQLDSGETAGQIPVWNGTKWVPGSTADSGAPKIIGRKDLAFHHYQSDVWESVADRWFKPGKMGAKVGNLVMVVMSVSVFKYHDGSVKLNSRIGTDAPGTNPNQGWIEYNAAGTAHTSSGAIERTVIIKVDSEDMKIIYGAGSFGTGGGNGDRQGWGYIAAWDMGPEIAVDI